MKKLMEMNNAGEKMSREQTIALRLIQEASVHVAVDFDATIETEVARLNNLAGEAFGKKDFKTGTAIKKAVTNLEEAGLWLQDVQPNLEIKEVANLQKLVEKWQDLPREESSREISIAITNIQTAIMWLSK